MTFQGGEEFELKISRLRARSSDVAKVALYHGAKVFADEIRARISAMPTETFRFLRGDDKFVGLPGQQKQDLSDSLGITTMRIGDDGNWSVKIGFDGYGSTPTKKYPQGLPNQLLARAIESGSSVRVKKPFVRPAINAKKEAALREMDRAADEEIKKIMEG